MRRPTRTCRLSIAAIVSLLLFAAVAGAGVRSLWIAEAWNDGNGRFVGLFGGRATYQHILDPPFSPSGHVSSDLGVSPDRRIAGEAIYGVRIGTDSYSRGIRADPSAVQRIFTIHIPLGPILFLLLIVPVRWLVARPANAPAFPVITDAKRA